VGYSLNKKTTDCTSVVGIGFINLKKLKGSFQRVVKILVVFKN